MVKSKTKKTIGALLLCLALVVSSALATPSITSTTEIRNKIAKNWEFKAQGLYEYNCLAWALGNTTDWVWPWGASNPTISQSDKYLASCGYVAGDYNISQDIYAFGSSSEVTHYARGLGLGPLARPMDAKWGHYELFTHTSTNPYYSISSGSYGSLVRSYSN